MPSLPAQEHEVLAEIVRELRARRKLSQEEVSDAAGFSRKWLGDVEQGRRRPSFDGIVLLCRALDVPASELLRMFEARLGALQDAP